MTQTTDPHPWYAGGCDALGPGGTCAECAKMAQPHITGYAAVTEAMRIAYGETRLLREVMADRRLLSKGRTGTWPCPCGRDDPHYHDGDHVIAGRWPWQGCKADA